MLRKTSDDGVESFGDRVRRSRERLRTPEGRRWTQGDLAKALDVKRNTVSRWENGSMLPKDPAMIAALARVLDVTTDYLLAGLGDQKAVSTTGIGVVHERPDSIYSRSTTAESLPGPAADLVLRYLDRLVRCGCTTEQTREAERILVTGARNGLAKQPFGQRDMKEVVGDIDAAWDFVTHVLRREGMRP